MNFEQSINELKYNVGNRNGMLMKVAMRGLGEGLSPEEVMERMTSADCGTPPLTAQEITRSVGRAKEYISGEPNTGRRFMAAMEKVKRDIEGTSPDERSFVRDMMRIGESAAISTGKEPCRLLMESSPVKLLGLGLGSPYGSIPLRRYMATAYVRARFPRDSEFIFATDNIKTDRDETRVFSPDGLIKMIAGDTPFVNNVHTYSPLRLISPGKRDVPTHVCVNPISGKATEKAGKSSYANKDTIARYPYALVEFDGMGTPQTTISEQAKFWYGAISSQSLDVVTLVYTVNKSIHGVVRLQELTQSDGLFGEISHEAAESHFKRQAAKLARRVCSDADIAFRCDRSALIDAARLTRMPGGLRDRILPHLLVWCAA